MGKEVAIVHYSAPKKMVGGVELVIDHHTRILSNEGYTPHVIYGEGGKLGYKGVIEHRIPILAANNSRVIKIQREVLKKGEPTLGFNKLKEELKTRLLEVLPEKSTCIVHNIPSMPFNFAATAAINELAEQINEIVFWLHDSILLRDQGKQRMETFPYSLLHYNNGSIKFVTPTLYRAEQFDQLPKPYRIQNMTVIPNGVSIEEYIKIDKTTKLLMRTLGLAFEDYIIVLPVRVTPRKNIELAIQVLDELRNLLPGRNIRLLITGPPDQQAKKIGMSYIDYLKSIIQKKNLTPHIIFCSNLIGYSRRYKKGRISRWSVADIYNIADLIFIPSREEGFGLPIIEAGASRKPVFCSRIQPFEELIKDQIEGNMFALSEKPKQIAFRIYKEWVNDKVDMNFHNVIKRFEWNIIVKDKLIPLILNK